MRQVVRIALAAFVFGMPALEALAQSMGPINTLPFGAKSRTKPNPDQTQDQDSLLLQTATPPKPIGGAPPEPEKAKVADK